MILLNAAIEIASRIDFRNRLDQSRSRLWYRKTRSLDAKPPSQGEISKLHRNLGPKASSIGSVFQR
jgi:hypothetical protein